mmetsp:Transcript_11959/g.10563  ORF Transcript_11959/g.10563 Transcript_11959/m.10563 type:complete len:235 (+) Transcript_11959:39-743(+)
MSTDFSLTTFTEQGILPQVVYSLKAVDNGENSLGIKAKNGVVIATEKKASTILVDEDSYHKVQNISSHIGCAYAGIGPDYFSVLKKARKDCIKYEQIYREKTSVALLAKSVAELMQEYTQAGGRRPFGISLLLAGVDDTGPKLFQVEPSGAFHSYKATALGKNAPNAENFLEKRFEDDLDLEDAIQIALLTMKEGFEGEMNEKNIEIGVISTENDKGFRILTEQEVKDYLKEAE